MGASFLSLSLSTVSFSSRRSSLVPTRMMGVDGQWWRTSGYHWKNKKIAAAAPLPRRPGSARTGSRVVSQVLSDFTAAEKLELESIKMHKKGLLDEIQKLKEEIDSVMAEILNFELAETEESKNMGRKQFSNGKKKFNMDPKKGINYLVENKLLERSAACIADFLYKEEGLNKTAIGEFLGERDELHLQTLRAFVELHEFSDLNLVQALRQFLWSFRLPGEAQKIDRMMEAFAARYCECNANVFQSTDTCYILSFAIIMLNTSLHNPNVKDKSTLERFVCMNRGINNGRDLPADLLSKLYESIRKEPFKIPEDDGNDLTHTFFNPDREGWLLKLGGRVKTWKRRWFILTDNCLYYFEFTTDKEPRGIIPLENLCVRDVPFPRKPYCLELYNPNSRGQKIKACKTETDGRVVEGKHQSYAICAASAGERDSWIHAIRASITKDPFYDLVSQRKKKLIKQNQNQQD
ncbi:cytohesin 4b isoform X1 [Festucalex cinctus]